ncbi:hypothetical protein N0V88_000590 [Collariella sp. IMI 366227]|nr:hypothetical protein N0V88_000590 [Collariella sp. IMI 366227]
MAVIYSEAGARKKAMYKRWKVQEWKNWAGALVVFPAAAKELLVRLGLGQEKGLLLLLLLTLLRLERERSGMGGQHVWNAEPDSSMTTTGGSGIQEALAGPAPDLSVATTGGSGIQEALSAADSTMAWEGCLWFENLMVADPLHILPYILSAIMIANVLPRNHLGFQVLFGAGTYRTRDMEASAKWRLRLQRGMLTLAMAVGPLTVDLPAALHLYWIASASLTWIQTSLIQRLMPLPTNPAPANPLPATLASPPTREEVEKMQEGQKLR